ncbi:MAG: amino acid permease [Promethearchaeia archaeon]
MESSSSSKILFLRPTSGLTKYFGTWTALFAMIGASLGTWQWLFVGTLQDMYPGINAGMTWGVGMGFMLIYTVMITLLSMAMPRSAGIYQISARGVNPVVGILAVWRGIIANPIIKMSEFYLFLVFLGSAFANWGRVTNNATLTSLGVTFSNQSPWVLAGVSIFLMALFSVVAYLGPLFKVEPIVQMAGGVFSTIGWVMAIFVLLLTPASAVPAQWNAVWGSGAYQEVVNVASTAGFSAADFSLQMTLMATVWPIGLVWPYLILHYGGEISDPAKNLVITQVIGGIILAVLLSSAAALFQSTFGSFSSAYTVAAQTGNLTQTAYFQTGLGTFTAVLAANPLVSGWILLSPVVVGLTATPMNMAWVTRGFFQASLDRMMPEFFGKLSRFHTPKYAIAYYFIFGAPFAFAYAAGYGSFLDVVTSLIGLYGIEMIFQSIAALGLPYLKKPLYKGSIREQPEIVGYSILSLLGIIILPVSLFVTIGFFQGAAFLSIISMCVQYGFSALWFVVFSRRLEKEDIDVETVYSSLPPE